MPILPRQIKRWILLTSVVLLLMSAGYYRYQFPVYYSSFKDPRKGLTVHNSRTINTFTSLSGTASNINNTFLLASPRSHGIHQSATHGKAVSHIGLDFLPQNVIDNVQTFVLFVGYPRSGHSILGSMMDAHPHMIIAHELFLLDEWWTAQEQASRDVTKKLIFHAIHNSSHTNTLGGWRNGSEDTKGYSLRMRYPWQGRYNKTLAVLGDKSGGNTAYVYMKSPSQFFKRYRRLKALVGVPIRVIHVVRNPFDIISTTTLYEVGKVKYPGLGRGAKKVSNFVHEVKSRFLKVKSETSDTAELNQVKLSNKAQLHCRITEFFKMATAVRDIIEYVGAESVLEVHNHQLVADPAMTMRRVCAFLGVSCSEEYLAACVEKTFRELSLSRQYVLWGREEREMVENMKKDFLFFHNYSFSGGI